MPKPKPQRISFVIHYVDKLGNKNSKSYYYDMSERHFIEEKPSKLLSGIDT
jgi:hypothetical protein